MNKNLGKLVQQLGEIWKQLGSSQRVTLLAATFVLIAGLATIAFWSSRTEYGLLYSRLAAADAAKIIAALDDAKVPYKVGSGGSSILVPADKVDHLRIQLADKVTPRGDGVGYEIFDKANFGISDFIQRANYVRAKEGELARTISAYDDIESARVMVVLPENRLLLDKDKYATASVFVRVRGNSQLPSQTVNSIRFFVANAVEGLKPNHVTVVDNLGNVLSENTDNDSLTGLTSTQLTARRNLEQYLARKAQDILDKWFRPGQAIVRVTADINYDTISKTEEKFDPDGQVIRQQTKNDDSVDSSTSSSSSPVGISANTSTDTNSAAAGGPMNNSKTKKITSTVDYEIGKTTSSTVQAAGGIKHIAAAVTIAARMEGTGADRKVVNRTPEEIEKLRHVISDAIGVDATRGDKISLEEIAFNDSFATEITQNLEKQQTHDFWFNLARGAAYPALGVLALLIL